MYNRLKTRISVLLLLLQALTIQATTRKVLFIGNSYTFTNNMPLMLQTLTTAMGDTLIYDESDPGGYTFAQHCTYPTTISRIFSQQWDVVVLQEQSELPSFPPLEVDTEVYPYAHRLDSMIHANDTCTQTMFLMTWGHANGDPPNCPSYPAICTYAGMQERLRESYLQMEVDNHATVAPVGVAWKAIMDSFPAIWLYTTDSSHPIVPGSFLEASVLYSSIFHRRTLGCSYTSGLTSAVAQTLQRVADRVVFDSLTQWQQYGHYPSAGFDASVTGTTAAFTQLSSIPVSGDWLFGDGGSDTAANPVHTYSGIGNYVVTHTVSNSCFTETIRDTLHVGTTLTGQPSTNGAPGIYVSQNGSGSITFSLPGTMAYNILEVYDATGRMMRKYTLRDRVTTDQYVPGMYFYRAYSSDHTLSVNGKMVVY